MKILANAEIRKVAIANPKLAPYGRESLRAIEYFKLREVVESKLVFGESIGQVNQYIDVQAVEIGFTAKSVVLAPQMLGRGKWIEVPAESYQPIDQGIVILKHGAQTNADASKKFLAFMGSAKARAMLEKFGYILP